MITMHAANRLDLESATIQLRSSIDNRQYTVSIIYGSCLCSPPCRGVLVNSPGLPTAHKKRNKVTDILIFLNSYNSHVKNSYDS